EITKLILALHDHGIPTWQDLYDLDHSHTEQRILEVLEDPGTASAVLWATPELAHSNLIGQVEAPSILKRAKANAGFLFLRGLAGRLRFDDIPKVLDRRDTREDLQNWNWKKVDADPISHKEAAGLALGMLNRRVREIDKSLPKDAPFRIQVYTRPPA